MGVKKEKKVYIVYKRCKGCDDYKMEKGEIRKIGKKNIYLVHDDGTEFSVEKEKIIDVFEINNKEKLQKWERFFEEFQRWQETLGEEKKKIEAKEFAEFLKRVEKKLKEWIKQNPPPKLPFSKTTT